MRLVLVVVVVYVVALANACMLNRRWLVEDKHFSLSLSLSFRANCARQLCANQRAHIYTNIIKREPATLAHRRPLFAILRDIKPMEKMHIFCLLPPL